MSRSATARPRRHANRLYAALLSLAFCASCALSVFGQTDARAILAGVYRQDTSHDASLRATLDVTDKDGHTLRKKFTLRRVGSFGNGKTLVRFTDPPATDRVRGVAPRERSERFAGSDFTYEDIAERSLDDFTYQPLPAEDSIENHKTFKILATPVAPERSQYKFIYYWVAQDVPCILHAEMYDQEGHKVREMHASGLRKESGIWGARKTEMRSVLEGTNSVLTIDEVHLNTGLDAKLFTPEALEKNP